MEYICGCHNFRERNKWTIVQEEKKKKKIKNANNGIRVSHGVKFDIRIIILNPELFKKKKLVGKEECKDKSHKLFSKIRKNHIEEGLNTVFYSILE